jgi:predicted RNA polymerase sigma factor
VSGAASNATYGHPRSTDRRHDLRADNDLHGLQFPRFRVQCCVELLALMLLDDARREARFERGELVLLADQDRSRWNAAEIARGREALERAFALQGRGTYVVQAAIASLHMEEPLDWPQVASLYGELVRLTGSAVVELNRAIAVAEVDGLKLALPLSTGSTWTGYQAPL